jgi:acetylornithine deacetylase/succinyl-diaminopimelate desuccinylase-like protein
VRWAVVIAPDRDTGLSRSDLGQAVAYGRRRDVRQHWVRLVAGLVALPTVGVSRQGRPMLEQAAHLLCEELTRGGFQRCSILRASRGAPPSVWAEWRGAPGRPLLLFYGHFDVQPPGPLSQWESSPWDAEVRSGRLHGRGASDNKGPLVAHVAGLANWLCTAGRLPVNVRLWLEGEEERGSPHLVQFLDRHGHLLKADGLLLSDITRFTPGGRPAIVTGLRGLADMRLTVAGPGVAVHSGGFGGEVVDPASILSQLVASLKSPDGKIAVPGFYRTAAVPDARERRRLAAGRLGAPALARTANVKAGELRGECGWSPGERSTLRPSLTVTELTTGRRGRVSPSAVPTEASARLNVRLVPQQDPAQVAILVRRYLSSVAAPGTRYRLELLAGAEPVRAPVHHPLVAAAGRALAATWGTPPVEVRSGGTIPIVAALAGRFGMPAALWALSRPADHVHGPNESFALDDLYRGAEMVTRLLYEVAAS